MTPKTAVLSTDYVMSDPPLNFHPTPSFKRDDFTLLNGKWCFRVLKNGKIDYDGTITVPYPPESELSGVKRITKKGDVLVYERVFEITKTDKRIILHFGASDNETEVFVNGRALGENKGGYLPFSFDITDYVVDGENVLTVTVTDSLDKTYPYGKQRHKRGGMWYTPISGIWQSVWLEYVPVKHIEDIKVTPSLTSVKIEVNGGTEKKTINVMGKEYKFSGESFVLDIDTPCLWTPESPYLYDFSVTSGEDIVHSYFALRTVDIRENNGKKYICLNGKPYFFHGLLDQGYFPDGIYTPKSEEAYKDDILKMKKLGFNMLRKHIKIEPDIFYYYCDKYGMAVFQDMVNNGTYSFIYDTALPTIGLKYLPKWQKGSVKRVFSDTAVKTVELLYNHPCVVYYTIFNEGWGQHNASRVYDTLKTLDTTRVWDTASGWFGKKDSDVKSEHVYFKKAQFKIKGDKPAVLSEFGGYSCNIEGHSFNPNKIYGYKICKTKEDFTTDLKALYEDEIIPLIKQGLNASVLTQITDVEDETNGIVTYDRKVIKPDEKTMQNIAKNLLSNFESATK